MEHSAQTIRLKLPEQDLQHLTLGGDQPKKLQTWVDELPLINMGETSRRLYQFIQELNRYTLSPPQRFQLLEIIRPVTLHVCRALGKHYLNQSLVLPEKARRVASLAQALQSHLANGYKLVAVQGMRRVRERDGRVLVTQAIHRAISALTDSLVRSLQLYFPVPRYLWLEIHQLYLLAENNGLATLEVKDADFQTIESNSITDTYGRALLISTAKPNQLRQQEIALVYQATEEWSAYIDVKQAGSSSDLFVFDLQQDRSPLYRTHVSVSSASCRYIDASRLVQKLAAGGNDDFHVPQGLTDNLLAHLHQAWGALTERSFKRVEQSGSVQITLGLSALHGHLSGGVDFEKTLHIAQDKVLSDDTAWNNPFLSGRAAARGGASDDPWSQAHDGGGGAMLNQGNFSVDFSSITHSLKSFQQSEAQGSAVLPEVFRCRKINASPGGYCLEWEGATPPALRAGETLGLRDGGNEWTIGVIRWVKQLATQSAQLGVELLAPRAIPCGVRATRKTGDVGSYVRALMLPELHAIGQPATLVLPTVGFSEGIRVELVLNGEQSRVVLQRRVNGTAGFAQYEYRSQQLPGAATIIEPDEKDAGDDFDSIWTSL